jgi:hypothetical protein
MLNQVFLFARRHGATRLLPLAYRCIIITSLSVALCSNLTG